MSSSDVLDITTLLQNIRITIPLSLIEGPDELTEVALKDLHDHCGNLLSGLAPPTSKASVLKSLAAMESDLTFCASAALKSPSLLPLVNTIFGPYDGQNPSHLRPRNRKSAEQIIDQLKGLRDLNFIELLGLCYTDPEPTPSMSTSSSEGKLVEYNDLRMAFLAEFKGTYAENLTAAIQLGYSVIYDPEKHFGRCIVLANSSGVGKSRTAHELRTSFIHLSTCFRQNQDPELGWPLGDEPADTFLKGVGSNFQAEERIVAYLASQLLEIEDVLRTSNLTGDAARMHLNSCFDFPPELENFSAPSSRRKHFMNIAEKAHQTLQTNRQAIQEAREKYMSRANKEDQMETKQKVGDNGKWRNKGITIWVEALYSLLVQGPRKKLADTMNTLNIQGKCIILVYDECGELEQHSREDDLRRPVLRMRVVSLLRAFKAADEFEDADGLKIFALLLDTSSSIFKLAPQGKTAPSARLRHPFVHLPPWNFFSFDVNATSKYDTLMQLDHVRLYGRALWGTIPVADVASTATKKLFCGSPFDPANKNHVLAAFSHRILLALPTNPVTTSVVAIDSVKKHMRLIEYIVGDLVVTAAPSEPILSLAAATALTSSKTGYNNALRTLVFELIQNGEVDDRGRRGDLFTRLLWTMARDYATAGDFGRKKFIAVPNLSRMTALGNEDRSTGRRVLTITFSDFLRSLLGSDVDLGNNRKQEALMKWGDDVHLNFTHFIQAKEAMDTVSSEYLAQLWSRTAAIQSSFTQPNNDGFMVGYKGDLNEPFDKRKLLILPHQVKAQEQASPASTVEGLTSPRIEQEDGSITKPEHAVIFTDLTTDAAFGSLKRHISLTYGKAVRDPKSKWAGYMTDSLEPNRFCINIRGHGDVYLPIREGSADMKETFSKLFQSSYHGITIDSRIDSSHVQWLDELSNMQFDRFRQHTSD